MSLSDSDYREYRSGELFIFEATSSLTYKEIAEYKGPLHFASIETRPSRPRDRIRVSLVSGIAPYPLTPSGGLLKENKHSKFVPVGSLCISCIKVQSQ